MTAISFVTLAALAAGGQARWLNRDSAPFPLSNGSNPAAGATGTGTGLLGTGTGLPGTGAATPTSATPTLATIPPNVTPNQGAFTLPPLPPKCTGATTSLAIGFWVNASQISIEDDSNWWGTDDNVPWSFWTNTSNVVFGEPYFTVDNALKPFVNPKPNVTWEVGSGKLIYMDKSRGVGSNLVFDVKTNSSNNTVVARDTPSPIPFFFNIAGSAPCPHPVGNTSCKANTIERTADSWKAYDVNGFLNDWMSNNSDSFGQTPMLQKFISDFNIGSGKVCTFKEQCQLIDICSELPNGGNDDNSPQIYLALIAFQNLSDMLHRMWQAFTIGETDTMTQIANLSMTFHQLNSTNVVTTPTPWWTSSSSLTLAGAVLAFVPGISSAVGGAIGLASAVCGMVYAATAANVKTSFPNVQAEQNQGSISAFLGNYVGSSRGAVEATFNSIFGNGTNLTSLVHDGAMVNRTELQIDCSECDSHLEAWMEQYLSLKTINEMWIQQNVFITYVPYGKIKNVDTFKIVDFDESSCVTNFLKTDVDKNLTICHTDDFGWGGASAAVSDSIFRPGMARLNFYNANDTNTKLAPGGADWGFVNLTQGAPGFDQGPTFNSSTGNGYAFSPLHAIESSLRGYILGGLGYEGLANATNTFLNPPSGSNLTDLAMQIKGMNATSPGVFTIPVCHLQDLNVWPTYWGQDGRLGGDYWNACQSNKDWKGQKFTDFVGSALKSLSYNIAKTDGSLQPIGTDVIGESDAARIYGENHKRNAAAPKEQPPAPMPSKNGA